jgi:ribosome-binding protein aMBF1 (putative translation factor)
MALNDTEEKLIHPIELMRSLGWDYGQLAQQMGVTEAAARTWAFSPTASNHNTPRKMAFILATKLYKEFAQ